MAADSLRMTYRNPMYPKGSRRASRSVCVAHLELIVIDIFQGGRVGRAGVSVVWLVKPFRREDDDRPVTKSDAVTDYLAALLDYFLSPRNDCEVFIARQDT
jgi:hypothetical protein